MDEGTRLFTAVRLPETTTTYLYFISLQQGQEVGQVSLAHVSTKETDILMRCFVKKLNSDFHLMSFCIFPWICSFMFTNGSSASCFTLAFGLVLLYFLLWLPSLPSLFFLTCKFLSSASHYLLFVIPQSVLSVFLVMLPHCALCSSIYLLVCLFVCLNLCSPCWLRFFFHFVHVFLISKLKAFCYYCLLFSGIRFLTTLHPDKLM